MQDYADLAAKNGVTLLALGPCQFCGADTERGVHECVEIFSLGFQVLDYSNPENYRFRFMAVDAHTLQHSEIHGRWNNHFHLTRQHLMFQYQVQWTYQLSPKLSDHLNAYKIDRPDEYLWAPPVLQRGSITTTDVAKSCTTETACRAIVEAWGRAVYDSWNQHHEVVDRIALGFLRKHKN